MGCFTLIVSCSDCRNEATSNRVYVDAVSHYAVIAEEAYRDTVSTAEALQVAVNALVEKPSAATLEAAKAAWLAAREPYLQTEVYRFYEGPIDHEKDGVEGLLNAWPMDENFVDYTRGPDGQTIVSGLINDPDFPLTEEAIEAKNEQGGEKNVATGYHAIEFLLWGQDTSDDGPGNRPFTDFVTDGSGTQAKPKTSRDIPQNYDRASREASAPSLCPVENRRRLSEELHQRASRGSDLEDAYRYDCLGWI